MISMNRRISAPVVVLSSLMLWVPLAHPAVPILKRSEPAHGALDVPTNVAVLRFHFDQPMTQDTWTLWQSDKGEFPPLLDANDNPWRDPQCVEVRIGALKPKTTYAVQLNSPQKQGFRAASGKEPLAPTVVVFTTRSATQPLLDKPVVKDSLGPPVGAAGKRPACPEGWTDFSHPLIGMQAHLPSNYWVRMRGGMMLTVEKQDSPATLAFLLPFRPRATAKAADIADHFARFVAGSEPRFKAQVEGQPAPDYARSQFTSFASGRPVEGRYCAVIAAAGTMAYIIGIMAPQGELAEATPQLQQIARGFGFLPPRGKWSDYRSPAGGFTMVLPEGWEVQSGDGRSGKDNIDWLAKDPANPHSRAFQWCPRYCSPQLLQDPLHAMRGYQAGQFSSHEQVCVSSLSQIAQEVKLLKMNVNSQLTELCRRLNQQLAQLITGLQAGQIDVTVYDCLAYAQVDGQPVLVAFITGIQSLAINAGFSGVLMDLSVTLRGWCAAPDRFVVDSPVLEKVCASMELTPAFLQRITQGNQQASDKIRETYAYMNHVDDQIRQSRWDTMDAIAEMHYDSLREVGGYVNEATGRIEQIPPDKVVKNSSGQYVSREEVERGVNPENATVLRDAFANDYMRGVYGRIEF
jgi:hypothetical protein